jgi:hypothetical protein
MVYDGTDSIVRLDAGYRVYFYDPSKVPLWGSDPVSTWISDLIADPFYSIPVRGSTPPTGAEDTDLVGCQVIADYIFGNPNYAPAVPVDGTGAPDMNLIHCYKEGVYSSGLDVPNGELAILEPGLYFFDDLLNAQGSLIGGYTPNSEGVALVFRESAGTQFKNRTGGGGGLPQIVALNAGDRYLNPDGNEATAAQDYSGGFVETNQSPAKVMSVIVERDTRCPVVYPFPSSCGNVVENANKAIDLAGNTDLYLAGVQYAPTDNMTLSGNTTNGGYVGQVWAWTITYTGGSLVLQEGDQEAGPGVLRLDAACTAPGTNCIP